MTYVLPWWTLVMVATWTARFFLLMAACYAARGPWRNPHYRLLSVYFISHGGRSIDQLKTPSQNQLAVYILHLISSVAGDFPRHQSLKSLPRTKKVRSKQQLVSETAAQNPRAAANRRSKLLSRVAASDDKDGTHDETS